MTDTAKLLDIMQTARELVGKDWGTCNLDLPPEIGGGSACASVAICLAAWGNDPEQTEAHAALLRGAGIAVPESEDEILVAVARFNDAQPSIAPVLDAFDKAIAMLKLGAHLDATPDADAALDVMATCDAAGAAVARCVVTRDARQNEAEVAAVASAEFFDMAQKIMVASLPQTGARA